MNQMTQAMRAAGLNVRPPTQHSRVWQCVKDNPGGITTARISALTKDIIQANVASLCNDMVMRGMLTVEKRPMKLATGAGWAERMVMFYAAVGDKYEMRPRKLANKPKKEKPAPVPPPPPAAQAPTPVQEIVSPAVTPATNTFPDALRALVRQYVGEMHGTATLLVDDAKGKEALRFRVPL